MIWGADYIFDIPNKDILTPVQICSIFGTHGWTLTYDFKRKQNQVAIRSQYLDEDGKQGLLFAKLTWNQVK